MYPPRLFSKNDKLTQNYNKNGKNRTQYNFQKRGKEMRKGEIFQKKKEKMMKKHHQKSIGQKPRKFVLMQTRVIVSVFFAVRD